MPRIIEGGVPKNPRFWNFTERTKHKAESIYEQLPEDALVCFFQKKDLEEIEKRGLYRGLEKYQGFVFSKSEESDYVSSENQMFDLQDENDTVRREMFSFRDNIKRFNATLRSNVGNMSQDIADGIRSAINPENYLLKHANELPAVALINAERIKFASSENEKKDAEQLNAASFDRCTPEEILGTISLEEDDLKTVAKHISGGLNANKAIELALINKATRWLAGSFLKISKKETKLFPEEIIKEDDWRKKHEKEFSGEILDDALEHSREITAGSDIFFVPQGGLKKGTMSGDITNFAENYLQRVRSYRELRDLASKLPENEKKILENFPR
jgi:hypothetical protein